MSPPKVIWTPADKPPQTAREAIPPIIGGWVHRECTPHNVYGASLPISMSLREIDVHWNARISDNLNLINQVRARINQPPLVRTTSTANPDLWDHASVTSGTLARWHDRSMLVDAGRVASFAVLCYDEIVTVSANATRYPWSQGLTSVADNGTQLDSRARAAKWLVEAVHRMSTRLDILALTRSDNDALRTDNESLRVDNAVLRQQLDELQRNARQKVLAGSRWG